MFDITLIETVSEKRAEAVSTYWGRGRTESTVSLLVSASSRGLHVPAWCRRPVVAWLFTCGPFINAPVPILT